MWVDFSKVVAKKQQALMSKGDHKNPAFLRICPNGRVGLLFAMVCAYFGVDTGNS